MGTNFFRDVAHPAERDGANVRRDIRVSCCSAGALVMTVEVSQKGKKGGHFLSGWAKRSPHCLPPDQHQSSQKVPKVRDGTQGSATRSFSPLCAPGTQPPHAWPPPAWAVGAVLPRRAEAPAGACPPRPGSPSPRPAGYTFQRSITLLWMDEILHHPRTPEMMIPL